MEASTEHRAHYSFNSPAKKREGPGRASGGISILAAPHLNPKLRKKVGNFVSISLEKLEVACFYFVPKTPVTDILEEISECLSTMDDGKPWLIGGDFNCRLDPKEPRRGTELLQRCREFFGLTCLNDGKEWTYWAPKGGRSTIDFLFTTRAG